jgi:outer membrane protein OmpA-like peptidoglycan-associated protein
LKEQQVALNLIDLAKDYLTPDVLSKMSALVGESPAATQKAMGAVVPSLAAIASNQASLPGGASKLMGLLNNSGLGPGVLNNFAGVLSGGSATDGLLKTGSNLVTGLLGDRAGSVASVIGNFAGIQGSSAMKLLSMGAPLLFGLLGKQVASGGVTAASLPGLLSSQKSSIMEFLPAGLAGALGLRSNSDLFGAPPAPVPLPAYVEKKKGFPIWGWLLPLLAIVAALLAWRSCGDQGPKLSSITLPCGTVLSVQEGTFSYNLANFMLKGPDSELPKTFVFDHLNFDSATTRLTPESQTTVTNLISIMKCYPTMQVELEGHTDNTGDAAANKQLSMDRANAVRDMLAHGGIDAARITTNGFGADKPIASNDTEDGKARNRRTELVVLKK